MKAFDSELTSTSLQGIFKTRQPVILDTSLGHAGQNLARGYSRVELERVIHLANRVVSFGKLPDVGKVSEPALPGLCRPGRTYRVVDQVRLQDVVDAGRLPDRSLRSMLTGIGAAVSIWDGAEKRDIKYLTPKPSMRTKVAESPRPSATLFAPAKGVTGSYCCAR